jgi:hypothetical protein
MLLAGVIEETSNISLCCDSLKNSVASLVNGLMCPSSKFTVRYELNNLFIGAISFG